MFATISDAQAETLRTLLAWAREANTRLAYVPAREDREFGFQFGGNPESNQVFKAAAKTLETLLWDDRDEGRENIAEGDHHYYTQRRDSESGECKGN